MKKILSALLAASMVATGGIANAAALAVSENVAEQAVVNEPTTQEMEAVIKKVRPLIDVPEDYTDFSWSYRAGSIYNPSSWRFSWRNDEKGRININCYSDGEIYSFNHTLYTEAYAPSLPTVSPNALEKTASDFVAKIAPHIPADSLTLTNTYPGSVYEPSYTYVFTRYENDTVVPQQTVSVTVSAQNSAVTGFYSNYTKNLEFKAPENVIGEQKAKEILGTVQKMDLSYRLKTEYDKDGNLVSRHAFLVYTPELSYVSVDAFTGEIYTERNIWETVSERPSMNGSAGGGNLAMDKEFGAMQDSAANESMKAEYELSEEELKGLEELHSLISRDEAIKIVTQNDSLYIDPLATIIKTNLNKDYSVRPLTVGSKEPQTNYVWDISFTMPEKDGYDYTYYHSMSARVDAKTGELLSFRAQIPEYYYYQETQTEAPKINYTEDEAKQLAVKFIEKMQPEKAKNISDAIDNYSYYTIKYIENDDGTTTPVYGGKDFRFIRTNEGVKFSSNSFNVGVEFSTGKVIRYNYTWYDDVTFEPTKDILSQDQALMALYSNKGFGINYEVNSKYTYNEYLIKENGGEYLDYDALYSSAAFTRPVYSAYDLGTSYIRAKDGKLITYGGEDYEEYVYFKEYPDIASHWAKDTLQRFIWAGYSVEGNAFEPNSSVDGLFFTQLCEFIGLYNYKQELDETAHLTRMDAIKLIINYLGYEKIASLIGVFVTDFADNASFKAEDVGYAAIARGFGLIEGDGENFRPYDTLSRAEALTIAQNVIDLNMLER